jgi:prepilin-type N-terminal cleavage/methylation domain-containing protein
MRVLFLMKGFHVGLTRKSYSNERGFSLVEIIVVIMIMLIIAGSITTMWSSFTRRQELDVSALTLVGDLRQAQKFSRSRITKPGGTIGFGYYGIRFFSGLGENGDRQGWKIIRFCDTDGSGNCEAELASTDIPITDPNIACLTANSISCEYVKSPVAADNADLVDNTFFSEKVTIDASSDFAVGSTIIFSPLGSATTIITR